VIVIAVIQIITRCLLWGCWRAITLKIVWVGHTAFGPENISIYAISHSVKPKLMTFLKSDGLFCLYSTSLSEFVCITDYWKRYMGTRCLCFAWMGHNSMKRKIANVQGHSRSPVSGSYILPCKYFGLISKGSEDIATEITEDRRFRPQNCRLTPPLQRIPECS